MPPERYGGLRWPNAHPARVGRADSEEADQRKVLAFRELSEPLRLER